MNTSKSIQTKSVFSFDKTLLKALPKSLIGRFLFWGALPVSSLLLVIGLSFLKTTLFSTYFPFLGLVGGILCLRWKTIGLGVSYGFLALVLLSQYNQIPSGEHLWQMGLIFSLAVTFFILLLAVEEIEQTFHEVLTSLDTKRKEFKQLQVDSKNLIDSYAEMQKSLEEEIKQLKEEAEQRRIERCEEKKRVELIESEIQLLTRQKEKFVEEAKKAREVLEKEKQHQEILDRMQENCSQWEKRFGQADDALKQFKVSNQTLQEQLKLAEKQNKSLVESLSESHASHSRLEEKLKQSESLKEQLQKEHPIQIEAFRNQIHEAKKALILTQEQALILQNYPQQNTQQEPELVHPDHKIRQMEGMYKQLRSQFEEKSRILSQTRKELFHAQSKLLALNHEEYLKSLSPNREETSFHETEMNKMVKEISVLEEEILNLEALVSHVLTQ